MAQTFMQLMLSIPTTTCDPMGEAGALADELRRQLAEYPVVARLLLDASIQVEDVHGVATVQVDEDDDVLGLDGLSDDEFAALEAAVESERSDRDEVDSDDESGDDGEAPTYSVGELRRIATHSLVGMADAESNDPEVALKAAAYIHEHATDLATE